MYNPCRIFFADEALKRASLYFPGLGTKAFVVTGKTSAKQSGAFDEVMQVLSDLKLDSFLYDKVTENPDLDNIMDGVTSFVVNDCDFLITIGGGSPIDAAKAISLAAANKLDKHDIYDTSRFDTAFPVVAIPTTAGTGSEVTPYAVLTDSSTQKKAGFGSEYAFPKLAIMEPRYTLSMSSALTLNTGVDALSHLLEGIYSNKRSELLYPLIFDGVKAIYKYLPIAINNPEDLQARSEMMRAALYGGLVIAHTSTTLQHSIGYPLTSVYNVPHGLANGIVMKSVMDLYYPALEAHLNRLFDYLCITQKDFYKWLEALQLSIDMHLPNDFIEAKVPEILQSRNMLNNPFEIKGDDIVNILTNINRKEP